MTKVATPHLPPSVHSSTREATAPAVGAPASKAAAPPAAQRVDGVDGPRPEGAAKIPGGWRGAPDSPVGQLVRDMVFRLRQASVMVDSETPLTLFARSVLDNPRVTNEQLLEMRQSTLEQMTDTPEEQQRTLEKYPTIREHPVHQFCAALFGAVMGLDPQVVSRAAPSLGLTGAPDTPLLYLARRERMQRNTILHDLTEHMRSRAGVDGLNKAVWGVEGQFGSTLCVPLNVHRGWTSRKMPEPE